MLQVQGMVAEYERAKILERSRRGKRHAAHKGTVSALSGAPYGYRSIGKRDGGGVARYEILEDEAQIVRRVFHWIGRERVSIGETCRRLQQEGCPTRSGKTAWDRSTVWGILRNPAYSGTAAFGKTRIGPMPVRLRPVRGGSEQPRRAHGFTLFVFRCDQARILQDSLDLPPHRFIQSIRPHLRVCAQALPTKTVGVAAAAAIIGQSRRLPLAELRLMALP